MQRLGPLGHEVNFDVYFLKILYYINNNIYININNYISIHSYKGRPCALKLIPRRSLVRLPMSNYVANCCYHLENILPCCVNNTCDRWEIRHYHSKTDPNYFSFHIHTIPYIFTSEKTAYINREQKAMTHLCKINIIIITSPITSTILKSTSSPLPTTRFPRIQLQNMIIFKTIRGKPLRIKFFHTFQKLVCKIPLPRISKSVIQIIKAGQRLGGTDGESPLERWHMTPFKNCVFALYFTRLNSRYYRPSDLWISAARKSWGGFIAPDLSSATFCKHDDAWDLACSILNSSAACW